MGHGVAAKALVSRFIHNMIFHSYSPSTIFKSIFHCIPTLSYLDLFICLVGIIDCQNNVVLKQSSCSC